MRNNRKFRVPTILIATRLFKLTVIAISKKASREDKTIHPRPVTKISIKIS